MTDRAMIIAEMARLLAIIERYWTTLFSIGDEIDLFTVQQVHAVPRRASAKAPYGRAGLDNAHS